MTTDERELIYDWNRAGGAFDYATVRVELDDETLRDGLQNPSVTDPPVDLKIRLLHLMAQLGIHAADIGLPGAGPRARADTLALAREIARANLPVRPNCAARTVRSDIEPIVEIAQATGIPIEAATFIGSSPIRRYAEGWTVDFVRRQTEEAVTFAVREGLPVMYVTEDTTRADPETLRLLYTTAIECGARRICLADTVGHATPHGARALVRFARELVRATGEDVKVDWHGHRDRGFGLANAFAAIEAGADRVHGTALGIGERVGNTEMDLLLVNLKLLGVHDADLRVLPEYCELVARACGVPIPHNYPVLGADAFRTGTGVHAAAILKARRKGHDWLADRVYSGVPASEVGRRQVIEVSYVSGLSNVKCWLEEHGYDPDDEALCRAVFDAAKRATRVLADAEIEAAIAAVRGSGRGGRGADGESGGTA
jgi:2-isopropylmalate synthase